MTKSIKKAMASIMAVMAIGTATVSTTVFAANKYFSFSVVTSQNDGKGFSAGNAKDDNEPRAYIHVTDGSISSYDLLYMSVYMTPFNADANRVTPRHRVTSNTENFTLSYNLTRNQGSTNYLCADTDRQFVTVEGNWYS